MATINLVTKFLPYVDEMFSTESKKSALTNNDFDFDGAKTVKVYKISTASMSDYDRDGSSGNSSRYGAIQGLDATTEEMTLSKDRSFTFAIDKLDEDETMGQLQAGSALARQIREVVIPEVDTYTYGVMCEKAGIKATPLALTADNICDAILKANTALDNAEVPETGRVLMVTPDTYLLMKLSDGIEMTTDIGNEMRLKGIIAMMDGAEVMKIPSNRLPEGFGFMIAHPCATVAPTKLSEFKVHEDAPGISGSLVEGRLCYDAFVLENKAKAIYYQEMAAHGLTVVSAAGSTSGKTALTVTPVKGADHSYKYRTGASVNLPAVGDSCVTGWDDWNGSADITAVTGNDIVIVEVDSNNKAVKAGKAMVTAKA